MASNSPTSTDAAVLAAWVPVVASVDLPALDTLASDELLTLMGELEAVRARVDLLALAATRVFVTRLTDRARDELPVDVSAGRRVDEICEAERVAADEISLATGLGARASAERISFSTASAMRTARLRGAMATEGLAWWRAAEVFARCAPLDDTTADNLAREVLAPDRSGLACGVHSSGFFRGRLRRFLAKHLPATTRRRDAIAQRTVRVDLNDDGVGTLQVTGDAGRVIAAESRVKCLARRLRKEGDPRTIAQLTSDITLDLLLRGSTTDLDDAYPGGLPPARVTVTVPLTTLLALSPEPGLIAGAHSTFTGGWVPADVARAIAHAPGTTWRRLVTDGLGVAYALDAHARPAPDPVTAASLESRSFAVPGYVPPIPMRRFVEARDGVCRAPGCTVPAVGCDLDHDRDHRQGGPTSPSNLSAKHRRHHNHKTRMYWSTSHDPETHAITWTLSTGRQVTTWPTSYPSGYDDLDGDTVSAYQSVAHREGACPQSSRTSRVDAPTPAEAALIAAIHRHVDAAHSRLAGVTPHSRAGTGHQPGHTAYIPRGDRIITPLVIPPPPRPHVEPSDPGDPPF